MNRQQVYEVIAEEQSWHKMFGGDARTALGIGPFQLLYENVSAEVGGLSITTAHTRELIFDFISLGDHKDGNTTAYYYLNTKIQWPIFILKPRYSLDYMLYRFINSFKKEKNNQYEDFQSRYKLVSPLTKTGHQFLSHEIQLFFNYEHGWTIEGNGNQLLIYKENKLIENDQLRSFIQVCQTIIKLFSSEKVL
jgi:hypothetical protein